MTERRLQTVSSHCFCDYSVSAVMRYGEITCLGKVKYTAEFEGAVLKAG